MAKFIQEFYDFLSFMEGKNIASKRPPEQIDLASNFVIPEYVDHLINDYVKTKKVSGLLDDLKRVKDIPITNSVGTLPDDYLLYRQVYAGGVNKVDVVEDLYWNFRANRKKGGPSPARPIAKIDWTKESTPAKIIFVLPSSIQTVEMQYFKKPVKVKYAYTNPTGTRYVYDDTASVDFEFNILSYPTLLYRVLAMIGVNLREGQLSQLTELFKSQQQPN